LHTHAHTLLYRTSPCSQPSLQGQELEHTLTHTCACIVHCALYIMCSQDPETVLGVCTCLLVSQHSHKRVHLYTYTHAHMVYLVCAHKTLKQCWCLQSTSVFTTITYACAAVHIHTRTHGLPILRPQDPETVLVSALDSWFHNNHVRVRSCTHTHTHGLPILCPQDPETVLVSALDSWFHNTHIRVRTCTHTHTHTYTHTYTHMVYLFCARRTLKQCWYLH